MNRTPQPVGALLREWRRRHCEITADRALSVRIRTDDGELALFSTIAVFGTAVDITLSELALESFFPADARSAEILHRWAQASPAA